MYYYFDIKKCSGIITETTAKLRAFYICFLLFCANTPILGDYPQGEKYYPQAITPEGNLQNDFPINIYVLQKLIHFIYFAIKFRGTFIINNLSDILCESLGIIMPHDSCIHSGQC